MAAWQFDKIKLIFKMENLKIQATEIILPSSLQINWESVGIGRFRSDSFYIII